MGLGTRRMSSQSNSPNPTPYNALTAAHAIAVGNKFYATAHANDWWTVNNAAQACLSEWVNNDRDAGVKDAAWRVSAAQITAANLDVNSILATMQAYQANFTTSDVQLSLAFIDRNAFMVPSVLATLQQNGMSYYLNVIVQQSAKVAQGLSNGTMSPTALRMDTHAAYGPRPLVRPPPIPPGGRSSYSCATDGALIFAAGLAFLTISVMTGGGFDVLAGAAWAGIGSWGSMGVAGWGVGHYVSGCGF